MLLLVISCSSNDNDENKNGQNFKNNTLEDYELFEKSSNLIATNQIELALIELDKIEFFFQQVPMLRKVCMRAYIYFLQKDYEKTRALSESYKNYYPGSKDIVYANYLEAMTYYVLIKKTNYSQKILI